MRITYQALKFQNRTLATIEKANEIIAENLAEGFDLTLRQLYYQFVQLNLIPNNMKEYKKLGETINNARLAGLIDWDHINDRTRNLRSLAHWDNPQDIVDGCAAQFRVNLWENQPNYVEAWIEKDALVGVLRDACQPYDVPYFSCRGYTSQSEMHGAAMRLLRKAKEGKAIHIIHLGDHDPSGVDMTRDIQARLSMFTDYHWDQTDVQVNRIALTMKQIKASVPALPTNFAKMTDSRSGDYFAKHGDKSWELDALKPRFLVDLIQDTVKDLITDEPTWTADQERIASGRAQLKNVCEMLRNGVVVDYMKEGIHVNGG